GQRLLVDEAAEHHVRHDLELVRDRRANMRMIVPVAGGPPGRDAVDQFPAARKHDAATIGALDRKRRTCGFHLRVGQPDMGTTGPVPIGQRCLGRRRWRLQTYRHLRLLIVNGLGDFALERGARYILKAHATSWIWPMLTRAPMSSLDD